jgi:hypothetical protein
VEVRLAARSLVHPGRAGDRAEPLGWSSPEVIALLIGGLASLAGFVRVESRSAAPVVPLGLFRSRGLTTRPPPETPT